MKTKLMALEALKKYGLPFTDENQARSEFGNSYVERELSRRAAIASIEADIANNDCVGWISYESLHRLKHGGNYSKGTVPIHKLKSSVSKFPIYTTPQEPAVIPEGWKLVPVEPTDEMLVAGQEAWAIIKPMRNAIEDCEESMCVYRAMLAAAPGGAA